MRRDAKCNDPTLSPHRPRHKSIIVTDYCMPPVEPAQNLAREAPSRTEPRRRLTTVKLP
jgi:hypothetical protein